MISILPAPEPDRWEEVVAVYQAETRPAQGFSGPKRKLTRATGHGLELARMVRAHGADAVVAVLRWVATSPHERAQLLRDRQYAPATLRRHFGEYLDFAAEPDVPPPARADTSGPAPREASKAWDYVMGLATSRVPPSPLHADPAKAAALQAAVDAVGWSRLRQADARSPATAALRGEFVSRYAEARAAPPPVAAAVARGAR